MVTHPQSATSSSVLEHWRPIPGCPTYFASDIGRIGHERDGELQPLRARITGSGYRYVKVCLAHTRKRRGGPRDRTVHSLVAEAFHGPRPSKRHETRHLDGDRLNNLSDNLCWGTPSQNRLDSVRHGTHYFSRARLDSAT